MRKETVRERVEGEKEICSCVEHKGDEVLTSDLRYGQLKQDTEFNAKTLLKLENCLSALRTLVP